MYIAVNLLHLNIFLKIILSLKKNLDKIITSIISMYRYGINPAPYGYGKIYNSPDHPDSGYGQASAGSGGDGGPGKGPGGNKGGGHYEDLSVPSEEDNSEEENATNKNDSLEEALASDTSSPLSEVDDEFISQYLATVNEEILQYKAVIQRNSEKRKKGILETLLEPVPILSKLARDLYNSKKRISKAKNRDNYREKKIIIEQKYRANNREMLRAKNKEYRTNNREMLTVKRKMYRDKRKGIKQAELAAVESTGETFIAGLTRTGAEAEQRVRENDRERPVTSVLTAETVHNVFSREPSRTISRRNSQASNPSNNSENE